MDSRAPGGVLKPHWMLLGKILRRNSVLILHFIRLVNPISLNEDRKWIYAAFSAFVSQ